MRRVRPAVAAVALAALFVLGFGGAALANHTFSTELHRVTLSIGTQTSVFTVTDRDPIAHNTTTTVTQTVTETVTETTTPPPPPPPPPPGDVTLEQVDGGLSYYGQFANPLPTSPDYFVIGAWIRPAFDQTVIDRQKDFGMNLYVGVENPELTNEAMIRANGMKAIIQSNERTRFNDIGSETAGWLLQDEIDMTHGPAGCAALDPILAGLPADSRFRYNNYGKGVGGQFSQTDQQAACFVNKQDITSIDVYWFTDPNESGRPQFEHGFGYGDMIRRLRYLDRFDGKVTPQWGFVELGCPGSGSHRAIQPQEIRSAVWHTLIGGARGVLYFDHSFGCGGASSVIFGSGYPANRAAAKDVNGHIKTLAPVLNSPFVTSGHSKTGDVDYMVKWDGSNFYVFAGARAGATSATFSMPCVGDATATRIAGESGSVQVSGGVFSDSFADKNAAHVYRIDGGSRCGL